MNTIMNQIEQSGALFNVREEHLLTASGLIVPGKKVLINEETNMPMSVVSSKYKTVSNGEVFAAFDQALRETNEIDVSDAQVDVKFSHNGAKTMVDITFPNHMIEIDGDRTALRITTLNSYDGSWRYMAKAGAIRYACMNGQVFGKFAAGYSSTHTASLDVSRSAEQMIAMLTQFNHAKEYWGAMLTRRINGDVIRGVIAAFLAVPNDETLDKRPQAIKLFNLVHDYNTAMGPTAYALYNALSDYVTHREYKKDTHASSLMFHTERFEKVLDTHPVFA